MADALPTEEPIANEPVHNLSEDAGPFADVNYAPGEDYAPADRQAEFMAAVDQALAPVVRNHQRLGAVGFGDLAALTSAFRQIVSMFVYGPPDNPTGESVDAHGDAIRARREQALAEAQRPADDQAAVFEGGPLAPTGAATTDPAGNPVAAIEPEVDPLS